MIVEFTIAPVIIILATFYLPRLLWEQTMYTEGGGRKFLSTCKDINRLLEWLKSQFSFSCNDQIIFVPNANMNVLVERIKQFEPDYVVVETPEYLSYFDDPRVILLK